MDSQVWQILHVFSQATAGKVKRLRHNQRARIAACDFRGNVVGDWFEAEAYIVRKPETVERAYAALRSKYGWQMMLTDFFSKLSGRYRCRAMIQLSVEEPGADVFDHASG